jgi:hypothetical protein
MEGHLNRRPHMRTIVGIALALAGICVGVMAPSIHIETQATKNQIYSGMTGLYIAHPSDVKNFPVELVPLP